MFRKKVQENLKGVWGGGGGQEGFKQVQKFPWCPRGAPRILSGCSEVRWQSLRGGALAGRAGQLGRGCATKLREGAPSRPRAPPTAPGFPAGSLRPALPPALPSPPLPAGAVCWGGGGVGRGVSSCLTSLGPSLRGHFPRYWQDPRFLLWSFLRAGKLAI